METWHLDPTIDLMLEEATLGKTQTLSKRFSEFLVFFRGRKGVWESQEITNIHLPFGDVFYSLGTSNFMVNLSIFPIYPIYPISSYLSYLSNLSNLSNLSYFILSILSILSIQSIQTIQSIQSILSIQSIQSILSFLFVLFFSNLSYLSYLSMHPSNFLGAGQSLHLQGMVPAAHHSQPTW